jgi:hypothetical protein
VQESVMAVPASEITTKTIELAGISPSGEKVIVTSDIQPSEIVPEKTGCSHRKRSD